MALILTKIVYRDFWYRSTGANMRDGQILIAADKIILGFDEHGRADITEKNQS